MWNPDQQLNCYDMLILMRPLKLITQGDTLHLECSYRTSDPFYQSVTLVRFYNNLLLNVYDDSLH